MATPITPISLSHQKVDLEADYKALIGGLQTKITDPDPLQIGGSKISRADLIARFQARVDAAEAVKAARGVLQKAVADERAIDAEARTLRAATKVFLQGRFGKQSPELQSFGFTQGRKPKPSAEAKAQARAKAKATRIALGTKGKQQKKAAKKALGAPNAAAATPATPATADAPAAATPATPAIPTAPAKS